MDQAGQLRDMINTKKEHINSKLNAKVITVSSGKGGVGKTNFSINLAIYLASLKKRVIVIDADFGLADIEVLLDIRPEYNFYHMIKGQKTISDIIMDTNLGIKFISGGSGLGELANVSNSEVKYFIEQFEYIDKMADIIIIDTGAGISKSVTNFIIASNEPIIITTPEPTSFTDAYTLIKIIKEQDLTMQKVNIVVNKTDDIYEADRVHKKLDYVCKKFLDIDIINRGYIPTDLSVIKAVKKQQPAILSSPDSEFSKSIRKIGDSIINNYEINTNTGIRDFIRKMLKGFSNKA